MDLIRHATETTDFYKPYVGATGLSDFPVIQKNVIRECYDQFLSTAFPKSELTKATTSGSYGTPLTFYLTRLKKARSLSG